MPAMGREGSFHRRGKRHRLVLAAVVINVVTVVDVPGLFVRGEIAVGTSPTVIVMQGDTRTREAY